MKKILSIIIPSYNIERYIDRTLHSIVDDTKSLSAIEIVIIDDGSTDRTGEIADQYAKMYPDGIHVIHKQNGGHGSVINTGISEASGKYFKVLDGDDWIITENLTEIISILSNSDADAILSPFMIYDEGSGSTEESHFMKPFDGVQQIDLVCKDMNKISIHGVIYKTSLLRDHHIKVDEGTFYEDVEYVCYPLPYVDEIQYTHLPLTTYRIGTNEQSMNVANLWKRRAQHLGVTTSLVKYYNELVVGNYYGEACLSEAKLDYICRSIAAVAEGQYRIYFVGPIGKETQNELRAFDRQLKNLSTKIYAALENKGIQILRKLNFCGYRMIAVYYQRSIGMKQ